MIDLKQILAKHSKIIIDGTSSFPEKNKRIELIDNLSAMEEVWNLAAEYNYKANKAKWTDEDLQDIIEKFHKMNMAYLTGKEDDNLDIPEFIKSLNNHKEIESVEVEMARESGLLSLFPLINENGMLAITKINYK